MELEHLRIFLAVAKYKSFSEAARRLYISHPTTSRAVAKLEKELGVSLIDRDNHVLGLSPAGEILLEEAERLLAMEQQVIDRVRDAGDRKVR